MSNLRRPSRRDVLRGGLALGGGAAMTLLGGVPGSAALVRAGRPELTHGIQAGDATARGATVWARADRPARMLVEVSRSPQRFVPSERVMGPVLTAETDYTGKVRLDGQPPGRDIDYRVTLVDPDDSSLSGDPVLGRLRTAPAGIHDIGLSPRPGFLPLQRRHHLRRRPDPRNPAACRRLDLAKPHHRGDVEGRRDPRGVPGQLPLQPPRRQPAAVQRPGRADQPVGRPRDGQQLVAR